MKAKNANIGSTSSIPDKINGVDYEKETVPVHLMKVDAQGYEYFVLEGAQKSYQS